MNCAVIPKTPQLARVKSFWFWWNLLWISLFFHEGQSKPSSRVCGYIMNDQNALMPHIFWKPWMYPTMISGLSFNILMLKIWPISTAWITLWPPRHGPGGQDCRLSDGVGLFVSVFCRLEDAGSGGARTLTEWGYLCTFSVDSGMLAQVCQVRCGCGGVKIFRHRSCVSNRCDEERKENSKHV